MGDLYNLDFPADYFDAIVMREVVEYFKTPENAVFEVGRIFNPNGIVVLVTLNYDNSLTRLIENLYHRFFAGSFNLNDYGIHPSCFRKVSFEKYIKAVLNVERHEKISFGITQGCVDGKR